MSFFDTAPAESLDVAAEIDKGHGRIEIRRCLVSRDVDWMTSNRRYPGEYRFAELSSLIMVEARR